MPLLQLCPIRFQFHVTWQKPSSSRLKFSLRCCTTLVFLSQSGYGTKKKSQSLKSFNPFVYLSRVHPRQYSYSFSDVIIFTFPSLLPLYGHLPSLPWKVSIFSGFLSVCLLFTLMRYLCALTSIPSSKINRLKMKKALPWC